MKVVMQMKKTLDDIGIKELLVLNLKVNAMVLTALSNFEEFSSPPKRDVRSLLDKVTKILEISERKSSNGSENSGRENS